MMGLIRSLLVSLTAATVLPVHAGELVVGELLLDKDKPVAFQLIGKSPEDVVGGEIKLGETSYIIDRVSQRQMVGASFLKEAGEASYAEFVVFSSSYSSQTATGDPWPKANTYHRCSTPYNSFLAIYRVNGKEAVKALGPAPYPTLMSELGRAERADVYCFTSSKGADHPGKTAQK